MHCSDFKHHSLGTNYEIERSLNLWYKTYRRMINHMNNYYQRENILMDNYSKIGWCTKCFRIVWETTHTFQFNMAPLMRGRDCMDFWLYCWNSQSMVVEFFLKLILNALKFLEIDPNWEEGHSHISSQHHWGTRWVHNGEFQEESVVIE
jgi:hypothetical protein